MKTIKLVYDHCPDCIVSEDATETELCPQHYAEHLRQIASVHGVAEFEEAIRKLMVGEDGQP